VNLPFICGLMLLAWGIFMYFRNEAVLRYRMYLVDCVFAHRDYQWRRDVYDRVSYNEMMFKFWKPLDSFYPDKSFIETQSQPTQ
jgi:hypothetical protein